MKEGPGSFPHFSPQYLDGIRQERLQSGETRRTGVLTDAMFSDNRLAMSSSKRKSARAKTNKFGKDTVCKDIQ